MSEPIAIDDIVLRPYRVDDAPTVYAAECESMSALQPWMAWCHPGYAIDESRAWLEQQVAAFARQDAYEFAIVSHEGAYLGGCGLNRLDRVNRRANLGYWVRSSATRRGVATAAVALLRDWGFAHTSLIRLEIIGAAGNEASQRVARRSGAEFEGTLRRRLLLNGVAHDATMFSITRDPVPGG